MKNNRKSHRLPLVLAGGGIFLLFAVLSLMCKLSNYLPFRLGEIFFLFLGVIYLILWIFPYAIPIKQDATTVDGAIPETTSQDGEKTTDPASKSPAQAFGSLFGEFLQDLARLYNRCRFGLQCLLLAGAMIGFGIYFGKVAFGADAASSLQYWHLVVLVALFLVSIILDIYCKHTDCDDSLQKALLKNARAFFNIAKIVVLLLSVAVTLRMLNLYDIQRYLVYALAIVFYYMLVMVALSLSVRIIRKEISVNPTIVLLLPFVATDAKELSVISFLEENTGITLRSLWSIKYVRKILPVVVVGLFALFWLTSGVVYVESYQQGVVYRFGMIQEDLLQPGLHFTFPYPIDRTEIYNTETISKVTIGYKADENVDNVWTKDHGDSEYKLLLGSGDELVSMNLRVEYKISDLKEYLQNASSPERIVEAKAYELMTDRTISTDLNTLLSVDREAFANSFREELARTVEASQMGIQIVSVIMESVHPPVEVAEVYQDFIAVGIDAERIVTEAEAAAQVLLYEAESESIVIINNAHSLQYERVAAARYEVAEFTASLSAYEGDPDSYVYYKYLQAIGNAYQNSNLVILGEGVDGSRIFWGSLYPAG